MRSFLIIGAFIAQLGVLPAQFVTHNLGGLRGTVTSVEGDVTVPTPDFYHSFNNDAGTGATATADIGDNCTLSNHTWVEDPVSSGNYALDANGSTTDIDCGTALDSLDTFSVSAFVNADTYGEGTLGTIIAKTTSLALSSWDVRLNDFGGTNGWVEVNICNTAVNHPSGCDRFRGDANSFDGCIATGWCHVGAVVSGCTSMACSAQIYLNGSPITTTQFSDQTGTRVTDTTYEVNIGGRQTNVVFDGDLDELKVWAGVALSDAQMSLLNSTGR